MTGSTITGSVPGATSCNGLAGVSVQGGATLNLYSAAIKDCTREAEIYATILNVVQIFSIKLKELEYLFLMLVTAR